MSAIFIVLPLALLVVFAAVAAFVWAVKKGQLDDLDTPPLRMLHEDEPVRNSRERKRSGERENGDRAEAPPTQGKEAPQPGEAKGGPSDK